MYVHIFIYDSFRSRHILNLTLRIQSYPHAQWSYGRILPFRVCAGIQVYIFNTPLTTDFFEFIYYLDIQLLSPRIRSSPPFPIELRDITVEIASKNLVCSVALTGVLLLQAGRQWAEATNSSDSETVPNTPAPSSPKLHSSSALLVDELEGIPRELDVARGRRRSHHDHLVEEDEGESSTASGASDNNTGGALSPSPRKRDGSRRSKRKPLGQGRKWSAGESQRSAS